MIMSSHTSQRMFAEIWIWIQTVAFMYMYHVLYNEIVKKQMEEYKEKVKAAALKELEERETMMQKKENEMLRVGLKFKAGTAMLYHTDEWFPKIEELKKEIRHCQKNFVRMDKCVQKKGLQFEFKDGLCVSLVEK